MPPKSGAPVDSKDNDSKDNDSKDNDADTGFKWDKYAKDARDFYLATYSAGPAAMQVWTSAWCSWATSAARTQDQLARGWSSIVKDPSRGETVLNQMREDVKQYILAISTIPERAVLEFLQAVSERGGSPEKQASSTEQEFVNAADGFLTAAADALNEVARARESDPTKQLTGPGATMGALKDPRLEELREQVARLNTARMKLPKSQPGR